MRQKKNLIICKNIFKNPDNQARKESFAMKMAEIINQLEKSKTSHT